MSRTNHSRALLFSYLITLVLLPWSWFPPFPWLHEHAQWSDVAFALTFILWLGEKLRTGQWPRASGMHVAVVCYLVSATLSLIISSSNTRVGTWKLIGLCELACLALVTADLLSRPERRRAATLVIITTSMITAAAGIGGLALFYVGVDTSLVGPYGDLTPSVWYARIKAGTTHPNMLASFTIFASAIVAAANDISPKKRRVLQAVLLLTVLLTFSRGILAFCLAAAIRIASTRRQRRAVALGVAVYVVIIATITAGNLSLDPTHPLEARFNDKIPSARWEAITSSLRTLATHPLTGSGVGTSPGTRQGLPFDAHMTLVNIGATMGVPALLSFVAIFFALWRSRRNPMDLASVALWSGLAGLMLDGLAQDVEDFRHLWVLIGLTASNGGENNGTDLKGTG